MSRGEAKDRSGPALIQRLQESAQWTICASQTVPDSETSIQTAILSMISNSTPHLILTTGGTGFSPRDVTPESVAKLVQRDAPGLVACMMMHSLKVTPLAALSRPVCGCRDGTLIVTLPGSPKGAVENLEAIMGVLPHALELSQGDAGAGEAFHKSLQQSSLKGHHSCSHRQYEKISPQSLLSNNPASGVAGRHRMSPFPMVSFDDALSLVLNHAKPVGNVTANVDARLVGSVLSHSVEALENVPAYRASVVDGYAVVASAGTGIFKVEGTSLASGNCVSTSKQLKAVTSGSVWRITTGAPVPPGADAVVMVEATTLEEATGTEELSISIHEQTQPGAFIREIGSDLSIGEQILQAGQLISPLGGELGVLISGGINTVKIWRKPVVAILSSGNEVFDSSHSGPLPFGAIRDTNRPCLMSAIEHAGFDVVDLGICDDTVEGLHGKILEGIEKADVVVTTGGVSMGEKDLLKSVLERKLKATIHFGRVDLKPGKPTTFATIPNPVEKKEMVDIVENKLFFGLAGNPVSAVVTLHLFVIPALKKISGQAAPYLIKVFVTTTERIRLDTRPEFRRVHVSFDYASNKMVARSTHQRQVSSAMKSMVSANALLIVPSSVSNNEEYLEANSTIEAILIDKL